MPQVRFAPSVTCNHVRLRCGTDLLYSRFAFENAYVIFLPTTPTAILANIVRLKASTIMATGIWLRKPKRDFTSFSHQHLAVY